MRCWYLKQESKQAIKQKVQVTEITNLENGGGVFVSYISDKCLISRIYKELQKLNTYTHIYKPAIRKVSSQWAEHFS